MTKDEFKAWRYRMGWTQFQAAYQLGFQTAQHVSRIERGERNITKTVEALCELLEKGDVRYGIYTTILPWKYIGCSE